jgi:hypothetical protein
MNFLKGFVSLDEEKSSIVVWILLAVAGFGIYKTYQLGDFPPNLLTLVEFLTGAVLGYNVADKISTKVVEVKQIGSLTEPKPAPAAQAPVLQTASSIPAATPVASAPSTPTPAAQVAAPAAPEQTGPAPALPTVPADFVVKVSSAGKSGP